MKIFYHENQEQRLAADDDFDATSGHLTQPSRKRAASDGENPPPKRPSPPPSTALEWPFQGFVCGAEEPVMAKELEQELNNPYGRRSQTETNRCVDSFVMVASPSASRKPPANAIDHQPQLLSQVNDTEEPFQMMRQPKTGPISLDQLIAEVKGIYAGLVMVETKCIEVDNAQSSNADANKLNNEQWQALIALHRTLLHEHHDFFLASQHPSASVPLSGLALKYAMPARMWRHGIQSFLELLRHRLPASLEHMLTFLYLAYGMLALLYETVPAFQDTWIECLGDLGRYRIAIEDNDIKDREVWTGVSQHWYSKASNKSPNTGRLYHHLAILARPNVLQQLYYYAKSLCVAIPFPSTRESVMTIFDPILDSDLRHLSEVDTNFVRLHGILVSGKGDENKLEASMERFLTILDSKIARLAKRWLEAGYFIGIATCCSLLGYGNKSNILMKAIFPRLDKTDVTTENSVLEELPNESFEKALEFATKIFKTVALRWADTNTLPFVHTIMVLIHKLAQYPAAMSYLKQVFPWEPTVVMLNRYLKSCNFKPRMDGDFPGPEKDEAPRPLPEDHAMRGLIYVDDYYPKNWFVNDKIDEDKKYLELASMADQRKERILYLGYKIAAQDTWLKFDTDSRQFSVTDEYNVDLCIDFGLSQTRELKGDWVLVPNEEADGEAHG